MSTPRWNRAGWLIFAASLLVPLAVACGGGGSATATPAAKTGNTPGTAGASATSAGGENSTDAAFVAGLCTAARGFIDTVTKNTQAALTPKAGSSATPDIGSAFVAILQALAPAYGTFAGEVNKLKPPADLQAWFQQAQPQMAAAAQALKDGKFDDPSLKNLSQSPLPDMPAGPRARLAALAARVAACKGLNPFSPPTTPGSPTVQYSQKAALQAAATGAWKGNFGTLTFNSDGTADFSLKICGTSSGATSYPFGVQDSCPPQDFRGKVVPEDHGYQLTRADGTANDFQAYIDRSGKLHVDVGTIGELAADGTGVVHVYAEGDMKIGQGGCQRVGLSAADTKAVPCKWVTEHGESVLQYTDTFGATSRLIRVPALHLVVDPALFEAAFSR